MEQNHMFYTLKYITDFRKFLGNCSVNVKIPRDKMDDYVHLIL